MDGFEMLETGAATMDVMLEDLEVLAIGTLLVETVMRFPAVLETYGSLVVVL